MSGEKNFVSSPIGAAIIFKSPLYHAGDPDAAFISTVHRLGKQLALNFWLLEQGECERLAKESVQENSEVSIKLLGQINNYLNSDPKIRIAIKADMHYSLGLSGLLMQVENLDTTTVQPLYPDLDEKKAVLECCLEILNSCMTPDGFSDVEPLFWEINSLLIALNMREKYDEVLGNVRSAFQELKDSVGSGAEPFSDAYNAPLIKLRDLLLEGMACEIAP